MKIWVNKDAIEYIQGAETGDTIIHLRSGKTVTVQKDYETVLQDFSINKYWKY